MMNRFNMTLIAVSMILILWISNGCSGAGNSVLPDQLTRESPVNSGVRTCLGMWQFQIDPDNETISAVPLRGCDVHMNALAFMEPPAGVSLAIDQIVGFSPGTVTVDIAITHPYPGANFATAFDVCGILISRGSKWFPLSDKLYFAAGSDVRLLNADGWTRWWNPVEFPYNASKKQMGYIDGLLGAPNSVGNFDATLNAYKYFASDLSDPDALLSDLDLEMRGAFVPGTKCIRRYMIGFTKGNLKFNYAVDASWAPASVSPPVNIPDDFPPQANRPEAYRYEIKNVNNTLTWDSTNQMAEGMMAFSVYVYDWFEPENNMVCAYPQGDELMGMCNPSPSEVGDGYAAYSFEIWPMALNSSGWFMMWIGVDNETTGYQGILPFEKQGVWFQDWIEVKEK